MLLALGDVAFHRDPMRVGAGFVGNRDDVNLKPERLARLGVIDQLFPDRLPFAQGCANPPACITCCVRALQKPRASADRLLAAVASPACEGIVHVDDAGAGFVSRLSVGDDHDVIEPRQAGFEKSQRLVPGLQIDFCMFALGDVARNGDEPRSIGRAAVFSGDGKLKPFVSIGVERLVLLANREPLVIGFPQRLHPGGCGIGRQHVGQLAPKKRRWARRQDVGT